MNTARLRILAATKNNVIEASCWNSLSNGCLQNDRIIKTNVVEC